MVELLADTEIAAALAERPGWESDGTALVRTVEMVTFPQLIEAVDRIAEVAEDMNHHPDIDIRWCTLKLSLSTHFKGGITRFDVALAGRIDEVLADFPTKSDA